MSGEPEIMSSADAADGTADDANHQNPQQLPQQEQRLGTPTMQIQGGSTNSVGSGDHLLNMLRAQVEYYFSAQNLGRDSYLRNMLSSEQARQQQQQQHQHRPPPPSGMQLVTPIEVIANFPKVWNICSSFAANAGQQPPEPPAVLIVKALQGSSIVTISSDGAWIGPTSQQLPPFTGSAPPSPSGMPPATIAAAAAQQQQFLHQQNLSPYPPPQMMVIPMQQPDGSIVHQSIPPPPYFMGMAPPPPPATATSSINSNNNNNRQATEGGGGGTDSATASLEDGSIPSQMKASSSKISVNSASAASLSSLSEQQPQVQMIQQAQQQQQPPPQFGGPMMGQAGQPPLPPPPPGPGGYPMSPLPPHMQQFMLPPYGVPMPPYPPYYNPQQMGYPPNFMPPPPPPGGNGSGPPPRGVGFPPPPYPYPGMPSQFMSEGGYPSPYPPQPHGYPPRHNQPNIGDNRKGGGGGSFDGQKKHNNQKKKNRNTNNSNFERKQRGNDNNNNGNRSPNFGQQQGYGGSAPSSPYFNNRHQKQYHHKKGGHGDNHQHSNNEGGGGRGKVFTSSDFPGLDGKAAIEGSTQVKAATPSDDGKKLSGYASALLKKNEDKKDDDGSIGKEGVAPFKPIENGDDDNLAQQTAAMEKEILSEFHDLSFAGKNEDVVEHDRNSPSKKNVAMAADDKTDGYTVETSPSSTTDNCALSPQSNNGNNLPVLPESATKSTKAAVQESIPIVHLEKKGDEKSSAPVSEQQQQQQQQQQQNATDDKGVDNSVKPQCTEVEKPKPEPPAAWGTKRLFVDVLASQNK